MIEVGGSDKIAGDEHRYRAGCHKALPPFPTPLIGIHPLGDHPSRTLRAMATESMIWQLVLVANLLILNSYMFSLVYRRSFVSHRYSAFSY
jgi:hypothetical protein